MAKGLYGHERCQGFSLVEMLIVLALVALVAGSAASSGAPLRTRFQLSAAASQVMRDLALARTLAVTANTDHRLTFSAGSRSYQLARVDGGDVISIGRPTTLPDGVTVESCTARDGILQFRPRGNAASFGSVVLTGGGETRRVVLNIVGHARLG